jgi:short subunit dehydrogenase-like uncharacterized protein
MPAGAPPRAVGVSPITLAPRRGRAGATPARDGCLTPALALGSACIERFNLARLRFSLLPQA